MIPLAVGVKAYLIYCLFRRELEVVFVWIVWKNLSRPDFLDPEIVIWELTCLMDFYKRVYLLLKKTCVRLPKENLFCPNNASETYIFISWRHQQLLLVAIQLQDSTFSIWD